MEPQWRRAHCNLLCPFRDIGNRTFRRHRLHFSARRGRRGGCHGRRNRVTSFSGAATTAPAVAHSLHRCLWETTGLRASPSTANARVIAISAPTTSADTACGVCSTSPQRRITNGSTPTLTGWISRLPVHVLESAPFFHPTFPRIPTRTWLAHYLTILGSR